MICCSMRNFLAYAQTSTGPDFHTPDRADEKTGKVHWIGSETQSFFTPVQMYTSCYRFMCVFEGSGSVYRRRKGVIMCLSKHQTETIVRCV